MTYLQYGSGEDYFMLVTPGRSPNSYEPDYAYDEDSSVDLSFPAGDRSTYEFDGKTPNPRIEEFLDTTLSEMELKRVGEWSYTAYGDSAEISCEVDRDY